jgi:hypothetical protein
MRRYAAACLVVLVAVVNGCVIDQPDTHPDRTATSQGAPAAVIVVQPLPVGPSGTAIPTSAPLPTLAPIPTSQPLPTAKPTNAPNNQPPAASACSLGRGNGDGESCPRPGSALVDDMDAAQNRVARKRPDLFSGDRIPIEKWNAYYAAVIVELQAMGYCAIFDGHDIAVKNTNAWNEQFHIVASSGLPRKGEGSYRATCTPAWF